METYRRQKVLVLGQFSHPVPLILVSHPTHYRPQRQPWQPRHHQYRQPDIRYVILRSVPEQFLLAWTGCLVLHLHLFEVLSLWTFLLHLTRTIIAMNSGIWSECSVDWKGIVFMEWHRRKNDKYRTRDLPGVPSSNLGYLQPVSITNSIQDSAALFLVKRSTSVNVRQRTALMCYF